MRALLPLLALPAIACAGNAAADGDGARMLLLPPLVACDAGAAPLSRLRVATWNIESARGSSLDAVGTALAALDADVALLQEVDFGVTRTGRADEPDRLAATTGAQVAFAEALPWDGGHYGLAVLSRLPFATVRRISLDEPGASERRIALDVTLCAGPRALRFVDVHADNVAAAGAAYATTLAAALAPAVGSGLVVGGDLNALPADPGPRAFVAAGLVDLGATRDPSPTWPEGGRREDYLFADAPLAAAVTAFQVVAGDQSDHRPVVATFAGPL